MRALFYFFHKNKGIINSNNQPTAHMLIPWNWQFRSEIPNDTKATSANSSLA
jgi:hypothetical protein